MSRNTKIIVLKSKEIIYTGVFILLLAFLILLLCYMFSPKNKEKVSVNPSSQTVFSEPSETYDEIMQTNLSEADAEESLILSSTEIPVEESMSPPVSAEESMSSPVSAEESMSSPVSVDTANDFTYLPGIYSGTFSLGDFELPLTVTINKEGITHVSIDNMDESVTNLYPLLPAALEEINSAFPTKQKIDDIPYSEDKEYTSILILNAIKHILSAS